MYRAVPVCHASFFYSVVTYLLVRYTYPCLLLTAYVYRHCSIPLRRPLVVVIMDLAKIGGIPTSNKDSQLK